MKTQELSDLAVGSAGYNVTLLISATGIFESSSERIPRSLLRDKRANRNIIIRQGSETLRSLLRRVSKCCILEDYREIKGIRKGDFSDINIYKRL